MRRSKFIAIALFGGLAFANACTPAQPPATRFPTGTYRMESWTFTFSDDGTFFATNQQHDDRGTYEVDSHRLKLTGDYCPGTEGTYTWAVEGTDLSFRAIKDVCADRLVIMERASWVKQP